MVICFKLFGNKYFELQAESGALASEWFTILIATKTKQDHGGVQFELQLLKLIFISIMVYDNRHWNYDKNRYFLPGEEDKKIMENIDTDTKAEVDKWWKSLRDHEQDELAEKHQLPVTSFEEVKVIWELENKPRRNY